jgi:hypothetical protein
MKIVAMTVDNVTSPAKPVPMEALSDALSVVECRFYYQIPDSALISAQLASNPLMLELAIHLIN